MRAGRMGGDGEESARDLVTTSQSSIRERGEDRSAGWALTCARTERAG